jgi:hypothetical protein
MCYVTGMRRFLVLGVALLLGGCVYNPYTGLWQPAGYYGYYEYGYRPYYPPPYYGSPYSGYYGSQFGGSPPNSYSPPPSGYQGSPQPSGSIQNEPLPMQPGQPQEDQHPPSGGGPTVLYPPRGG